MALLTFEVPHQLSKEDAQKRVVELTNYWSTKYGLKVAWAGDTATLAGKVMGITLSGKVYVQDSRVRGEATDPGFLFRDKAKKYIQGKFERYLHPSNAPGSIIED